MWLSSYLILNKTGKSPRVGVTEPYKLFQYDFIVTVVPKKMTAYSDSKGMIGNSIYFVHIRGTVYSSKVNGAYWIAEEILVGKNPMRPWDRESFASGSLY